MRPNRSYQSKSFADKRKRRVIVGIIATVVILMSWSFVLSRLTFLPYFNINSIRIHGASPDMATTIERSTANMIEGTYAGLFSKSNYFIYPKSQIIRNIASASALFENININLEDDGVLNISVSEKVPDAVVCIDLPDLDLDTDVVNQANCHVVDGNGRKLRAVREGEIGEYERSYMPEATTTSLMPIRNFVSKVRDAGIVIDSTLIKDDNSYEIYAHNPNAASLVVIQANDKADLSIQAENLILFWRKMLDKTRTDKSLDLEWSEIKLQYPPNVYYTEAK